MIFLTYLENLNQLNILAIIKTNSQDISVKVDNNGLININKFRLMVKCIHLIEFNPCAVYRLSSQLIENKYYLNYLIKSNNFVKNNSIKNDSNIPASFEIINDWIFCHNHNHSHQPKAAESESNINQTQSSKLVTLDQIISIINLESIGSRLLFESDHKKESLFIKIINPSCLIGFKKDLKESIVNEVYLKSAAHLQFQLLNVHDNSKELKDVRFRFDVTWYLVKDKSFQQFYQILLKSKEEIRFFENITSASNHKYFAYLYLQNS